MIAVWVGVMQSWLQVLRTGRGVPSESAPKLRNKQEGSLLAEQSLQES